MSKTYRYRHLLPKGFSTREGRLYNVYGPNGEEVWLVKKVDHVIPRRNYVYANWLAGHGLQMYFWHAWKEKFLGDKVYLTKQHVYKNFRSRRFSTTYEDKRWTRRRKRRALKNFIIEKNWDEIPEKQVKSYFE